MECLCEIASFMAARYPEDFVVTRAQYDAEKPETHGDSLVGPEGGAVTSVRNNITGEFHDFAAIAAAEGPDWNPMRVAGRELSTKSCIEVLVPDSMSCVQCSPWTISPSWSRLTRANTRESRLQP